MPTEHSIWLMPSGEVRQELAHLIAALGAEYQAPVFPPHVTLIGELAGPEATLAKQARELAERLKPYELQLGAVDGLDEYYRCLFVHIEETEPVLGANRTARQVLHREDDAPYMPHMSLLYGHFSPEIKERIIARIGRRMTFKFQATSIYLYSTLGEPRTWYCVGEYPMGTARG